MRKIRKLFQRDFFSAIVIEITADGIAQMGHFFICRSKDRGEVCLSRKQDNENLHEILTDCFVPRRMGLGFPQHHLQIKDHRIPHLFEIDNAEVRLIVGCGKLQSLDAKDDISHRVGVNSKFGVGHVGIDDDEIICRDGKDVIFHLKLSDAF